jgi:HK97 gp10 family phage protein
MQAGGCVNKDTGKAAANALNEYAERMRAAASREVLASSKDVLAKAQKNLVEDKISNFGILSGSGKITPDQSGVILTREVDFNGGYAVYVERGTRAHTPPLESIKLWAKGRGLPDEAAGAIWNHIRRKGTKKHPFLEPAADEVRPKFQSAMRFVLKNNARGMSVRVSK